MRMPPPEVAAHLDRLRSTSRDLVSLVTGAEPAALRREPMPGEWSAATVVSHLADAELVYGVRLRLIVAEDRPMLTAFDEEAWADRFADVDDEPKETLTRWRALRDSNLRLLDALVDGEWERTGVHQQKGIMSVTAVVKLLAEHDRAHLDQIRHALA
jgi:uncharacterized damage-inducible protein DinB